MQKCSFYDNGSSILGKVVLPLQRGAYFLKAGSRASSPSFFNEVEICHLGAILGPSWGHPWPTHVADIAEIDKDKKILAQIAKKKRRAGGGRPPQGSQSAARPLWSGPRRVRPALKSCQGLRNLSSRQYLCLKYLAGIVYRPLLFPQETCAFRRPAPRRAPCPFQK